MGLEVKFLAEVAALFGQVCCVGPINGPFPEMALPRFEVLRCVARRGQFAGGITRFRVSLSTLRVKQHCLLTKGMGKHVT